jgi:glucose/arabinose dehydrogenase
VDLGLQTVEVSVPEQYDRYQGMTFDVPSGFSVDLFAAGLRNPRFMAVSPEGVLYVSNMSAGQILALPDRDEDGVADEMIVVAQGFSEANSLAFYKGDLYVGDTHQVLRLHDEDGDGIYGAAEKHVLVDLPSPGRCCSNGWHTTRTIVFDEINEKLYVGIGVPCDLCRSQRMYINDTLEPLEPNDEWGTILEFNADGTGKRIFASGIRNVVGMTLHPLTNELWGDHNGFDIGGPHVPPEWVDIIREDDFMGYPFAYGYQVITDSTSSDAYNAEDWHVAAIRSQRLDKVPDLYRKVGVFPLTAQDSLLVQKMKRPVALFDGHLAPLGLHFYTQQLFPERYRNTAFVALHNGRSRNSLAAAPGFRVVALFSNPDGSDARIGDFMTGFGPDPGQDRPKGAPVGIVSDQKGRLYVSDNYRNLVFRLTHTFLSGSWEHGIPDTVVLGGSLDVNLRVRPERTDPDRQLQVTGNLDDFGGSAFLSLGADGDNVYRWQGSLPVTGAPGLRTVSVLLSQDDVLEGYQLRLTKQVVVLPPKDLTILDEGIAPQWQVATLGGAEVASKAGGPVFRGEQASAFRVAPDRSVVPWTVDFLPATPVATFGYKYLHIAMQPEQITTGSFTTFSITIHGSSAVSVDLSRGEQLHLDLDQPLWQELEIPLERFRGPLQKVSISGNFTGTLHIDDVRFVTSAETPAQTAVAGTQATPESFALSQSYPNPFNSMTVIPFVLPRRAHVQLEIYDLAGQRVVTLADGEFAAGPQLVTWNALNESGQPVASGVYLYRMLAEGRTYSRRLALLR